VIGHTCCDPQVVLPVVDEVVEGRDEVIDLDDTEGKGATDVVLKASAKSRAKDG
jgi:hypothetical protein